jgi:hypothetical protein
LFVEKNTKKNGAKKYFVFFRSIFEKKKLYFNYFTIRGGSLKKIAKKIIPNVPINKKV